MRKFRRTLLILMICLMACPQTAWAKKRMAKALWIFQDGVYIAVDEATLQPVRNKAVGRYFADKNGARVTNAFRRGVYYNGMGRSNKKFKGGFIRSLGQLYYFRNQKKVKGYRKIGKYYYCFGKDGAAQTGVVRAGGKWRIFRENGKMIDKSRWVSVDGKRYFLRKKGLLKEGFFKKNNKKYYQTAASGIWKGQCVIGGLRYVFDDNGALNLALTERVRHSSMPLTNGNPSDMLFFTRYESGTAAYAQTGGDHGRAYGKYQFDYRYSLVPLIRFCYGADPVTFTEFYAFTFLQAGDKRLISGNDKAIPEADLDVETASVQPLDLACAWTAVYNRNPVLFTALQDQFAMNSYYKPAENILKAHGIHMDTRTYVERGAVFSYAVQEGSSVAADGVIAAGITDATPSRDFLNMLYDYRWTDPRGWNKNILYYSRYQREKAEALGILTALGG